jgi:hypothetical protein
MKKYYILSRFFNNKTLIRFLIFEEGDGCIKCIAYRAVKERDKNIWYNKHEIIDEWNEGIKTLGCKDIKEFSRAYAEDEYEEISEEEVFAEMI